MLARLAEREFCDAFFLTQPCLSQQITELIRQRAAAFLSFHDFVSPRVQGSFWMLAGRQTKNMFGKRQDRHATASKTSRERLA